jgi:muramoyltetrapeptide carboxypeptidase LdcA involved in peptidoglycan recycling
LSIRYPAPLRPGAIIGVTAPSSGVRAECERRLVACVDAVRSRGFEVRLGDCLRGGGIVTADAATRAGELNRMLADPDIAAIVPPWGGELLIDLLDRVDFSAASPTWLVGYSDISTLLLPYTLRTGVATLHAPCFMEARFRAPDGLAHFLDVLALPAGAALTQTAATRYQTDWPSYERYAHAERWNLEHPTRWKWLGHEDDGATLTVSGRLLGGCLETIAMLPGTPFGDVPGFDGDVLFYFEVCEDAAPAVCRMLHHLRHAGWFRRASAILVGRTRAPAGHGLDQHGAVVHALGDLDIPIVYDVDVGHVAPQACFVNGALATVVVTPASARIEQRLV